MANCMRGDTSPYQRVTIVCVDVSGEEAVVKTKDTTGYERLSLSFSVSFIVH